MSIRPTTDSTMISTYINSQNISLTVSIFSVVKRIMHQNQPLVTYNITTNLMRSVDCK